MALRGARGFGNRLTGRDKREISGIGGGLWIANGELPIIFFAVKVHSASFVVAVLFASVTLSIQPSAQADTWGGGTTNEFTIDFVNIGNAGNAADTTTYGAVPYEYRIGTYEIPQGAIDKATASGMANVAAGPWTGNRPAADVSWYEAAAFVNWMNTSTGRQAAYDLSWNGSAWSMTPWTPSLAWSPGGQNLFRHKDAYYFLPSENEWYKAAYYVPSAGYLNYPTDFDGIPIPMRSGTPSLSQRYTAVYDQVDQNSPAEVSAAGALSMHGTMGQGGNVWEWVETAFDGTNNSPDEDRVFRGGNWTSDALSLHRSSRSSTTPAFESFGIIGFRVASVPEPSTYALLLMTAAGVLWMTRGRR